MNIKMYVEGGGGGAGTVKNGWGNGKINFTEYKKD